MTLTTLIENDGNGIFKHCASYLEEERVKKMCPPVRLFSEKVLPDPATLADIYPQVGQWIFLYDSSTFQSAASVQRPRASASLE